MELIKQIKNAEAQSKQLIEQAEAKSAQMLAAAANENRQQLEQAAKQRDEIIKKAVSHGREQGLAEAEKLKATAEQVLKDLRKNAAKKSDSTVTKIVEEVKSIAD